MCKSSFFSQLHNKLSYRTYVESITTLGWLAFALSVSAVASNQWLFYGGNKSEGLFNGEESDILFPVERSTWLDAVSGLYTLGVILNGIGMIGMNLALWKNLPSGLHALFQTCISFAGTTESIAAGIYLINVVNGYSGSGNDWKTETTSYGYVFALTLTYFRPKT